MAAQSIEFTKRQLTRARKTAEAALGASPGQQMALKALAPDMVALCKAFEGADETARDAEQAVAKEVRESEAAVADLRKLFDQTREVVAAKSQVAYEAASAFDTPDDFLNAAEDLEAQLQDSDPSWAAPLLGAFTGALEAASKEYAEGSTSRKAQQKAATDRETAMAETRPIFVRFRRIVRATFGSSSREYRELLDRRGRKGGDPDPDPTKT